MDSSTSCPPQRIGSAPAGAGMRTHPARAMVAARIIATSLRATCRATAPLLFRAARFRAEDRVTCIIGVLLDRRGQVGAPRRLPKSVVRRKLFVTEKTTGGGLTVT